MESDKISVIVPVYNVRKYLAECIDSILSQTYTNLEILLVDDGSTDGSGAICDEYYLKDKRIKVIHQKNSGVAAARNSGLESACGEYIAFIDSDDWWGNNFLYELHEKITDCGFVFCSCRNARPDGSLKNRNSPVIIKNGIVKPAKYNIPCWHGLFRRDITEKHKIRFTAGRRSGEDQEFTFKYIIYCSSFAYAPQAVYFYRLNSGSTMHKKSYIHFDAVDAMLDTAGYAEKNGTAEQGREYYKNLVCLNALRIIEFSALSLLSSGEKPKNIMNFMRSREYDKLINKILLEKEHYSSNFIRVWRLSPYICLYIYAVKKYCGRLIRGELFRKSA